MQRRGHNQARPVTMPVNGQYLMEVHVYACMYTHVSVCANANMCLDTCMHACKCEHVSQYVCACLCEHVGAGFFAFLLPQQGWLCRRQPDLSGVPGAQHCNSVISIL